MPARYTGGMSRSGILLPAECLGAGSFFQREVSPRYGQSVEVQSAVGGSSVRGRSIGGKVVLVRKHSRMLPARDPEYWREDPERYVPALSRRNHSAAAQYVPALSRRNHSAAAQVTSTYQRKFPETFRCGTSYRRHHMSHYYSVTY
jgi:hypothetical protein